MELLSPRNPRFGTKLYRNINEICHIKEEPADPDSASGVDPRKVRIKSEFLIADETQLQDEGDHLDGEYPDQTPGGHETLKCLTCNRSYSSFSALSKHMHTRVHLHNVKVSKGGGVPSCEEEELPSLPETLRPRTTFPVYNPSMFDDPVFPPVSRQKKLRCRICGLVFRFPAELRRHLCTKKHRTNERIAERGLAYGGNKHLFMCPMGNCNFSCTKGVKLLSHMRAHGLSEPRSESGQNAMFNRPESYFAFDKPVRQLFDDEDRQFHQFNARVGDINRQYEQRQFESIDERPTVSQYEEDRPFEHASSSSGTYGEDRKFEQAYARPGGFSRPLERDGGRFTDQSGRISRSYGEDKQFEQVSARSARERPFGEEPRFEQPDNSKFEGDNFHSSLSRLRTALERKTPRPADYLSDEMHFDDPVPTRKPPSNPRQRFKCELCNKHFLKKCGLSKHRYFCPHRPNAVQPEASSAEKQEVEENVPSEEMHCALCSLTFTSRSVFISHVQMYHKGSSLEDGLLRPKKLPVVASSRLKAATRKGHGYVCNQCGKVFNLVSSLNYHLKLHFQQQQQRQHQEQQLHRQQQLHLQQQQLQQQHQQQQLQQQQEEELQEQPGQQLHEQQEQQLQQQQEQQLQQQQEQQLQEQHRQQLLQQHQYQQEPSDGIGVYFCKFCKKNFERRKKYQEHIRTHFLPPGSKEVLCHKCFKLFSTRSAFCIHRRSGVCYPKQLKLKIYSCNICHHSFKNCETLEEHKLKAHAPRMPETHLEGSHFMSELQSDHAPSYALTEEPEPHIEEEDVSPGTSSVDPGVPRDPYRCHICRKRFPLISSVKKHIWNAHNKKKLISAGLFSSGKSSMKMRLIKPWKCRHCKSAHSSRRMLVHHLKKCQYNVIQEGDGNCLQCGKWCESERLRLCRFCISDPRTAPTPQFASSAVTSASSDQIQPQPSTAEHFFPTDEFLEDMIEPVEVPIKSPAKQRTVQDITLIKCPAGSKYFLKEIHMIKHYAQCDGYCENRCSHCRRMFHSPSEYKHHLVYNKCYGTKGETKRASPKKRLPEPSLDPANFAEAQLAEPVPTSNDNLSVDESLVDSDKSVPSSSTNPVELSGNVRICNICNKPINMQRALYRHIYTCFKMYMFSQESITCGKCERTFSKHLTMRENTSLIKSHVLDCYYVPYFEGEDVLANGEPAPPKPEFLCYICSFGFPTNARLQLHLKEHRNMKDALNRIILRLEDSIVIPQEFLTNNPQKAIIKGSNQSSNEANWERRSQEDGGTPQEAQQNLELNEKIQDNVRVTKKKCIMNIRNYASQNILYRFLSSGKKGMRNVAMYDCEVCHRRFVNRNKYRNHKKVHGIIHKNIFPEAKVVLNAAIVDERHTENRTYEESISAGEEDENLMEEDDVGIKDGNSNYEEPLERIQHMITDEEAEDLIEEEDVEPLGQDDHMENLQQRDVEKYISDEEDELLMGKGISDVENEITDAEGISNVDNEELPVGKDILNVVNEITAAEGISNVDNEELPVGKGILNVVNELLMEKGISEVENELPAEKDNAEVENEQPPKEKCISEIENEQLPPVEKSISHVENELSAEKGISVMENKLLAGKGISDLENELFEENELLAGKGISDLENELPDEQGVSVVENLEKNNSDVKEQPEGSETAGVPEEIDNVGGAFENKHLEQNEKNVSEDVCAFHE